MMMNEQNATERLMGKLNLLSYVTNSERAKVIYHATSHTEEKDLIDTYMFVREIERIRKEAEETHPEGYMPKVALVSYEGHDFINRVDRFAQEVEWDKRNDGCFINGVKVIVATNDMVFRGSDLWHVHVTSAQEIHRPLFEEALKRLRGGKHPKAYISMDVKGGKHWLNTEYLGKASYENGDFVMR